LAARAVSVEADGFQPSCRGEAVAFDASVNEGRRSPGTTGAADGAELPMRVAALESQLGSVGKEGAYRYETRQRPRWRFVFRDARGALSSRRGFLTPEDAAAARRCLLAAVRRGQCTHGSPALTVVPRPGGL
jgi:hypothetical protein